MRFVRAGTQELSGHTVGLPGKFADVPVELDVRNIEQRLARRNILVDLFDELPALEMEQLAAVLVHALEIGFLPSLRLVVAALETPNVEPVRGTRTVHSKQIEAHRNPLVDVFLNECERHDAGLDDALDAVLAGAQVEGLLLEHGDHGLRQGRKSRIAQHGELVFAVAVHEIRVGEKVEPVVDVLIEGAEQALLVKGAPLEHLLRLDASGVAEMADQQVAHLPAVAHLFGHHAAEGLAVVLGGSVLKQAALLLDRSKLGVALKDDQVHESVAHALVRDLNDFFPLRRAFFEKRAKSFAAIFGAETFHLRTDFEFQGALELLAVFGEQDLFHGANRERRSLSNFRGQCARFGRQMGCGHDAIHDANPQGGLRVNQVSGVKHFRGARFADQARQEEYPSKVRKQPDLGKALSKHGVLGGDANVCGKREVHSSARGCSVYSGNHGLAHGTHGQHHFFPRAQERLELGDGATVARVADRGKVASGAKSAACSSERNDADIRVLRGAVERLAER